MSHRFVPILLGLLASLVVVGTTVASTTGRPYRPDGLIRYYSFHSNFGTYVDPSDLKGNDIYNTTGKYQTAKQLAAGTYEPGDYYVFQVLIQNDGPADSFMLHATGTGNWVVKYFRGKTNITSAVVNGTYETPTLDGTNLLIKVKVWIGDAGTSMERLVKITSVGDPTRSDTVRIKASYSGCGC